MANERLALVRLARWVPAGVLEVVRALESRGGRAVLVGGVVRDAFLGRQSHDWDLATNLRPAVVAEAFARVVRAGEKHGTIMVLGADGPIEVTTFRSEGPYLDGRRPESVEFHDDLEADLARRDFTINALAADLGRRELVDPFGGVADLGRALVRCVGDPVVRFDEDGLRPLRAVRFAAVLGFRLHPETLRAIPGSLGRFALVSRERKRDELERLFAQGHGFVRIGRLLHDTGLLGSCAPGLMTAPVARLAALDRLAPGRPWLRLAGWAALAGLTPGELAGLMAGLRASTVETRNAQAWFSGFVGLSRKPPSGADLRRWLAATGEAFAAGAAELAEALRPGPYDGFARTVRATLARHPVLTVGQLAVRGNDLLAAGLSGPALGVVLRELLAGVLEDPKLNRPSHLLALAHRLSTGQSR